jgi:CheY-like chemotaxis protein
METQKKKILVVDDEVRFTRLLKLNLEQTKAYEIQTENESSKALETAERFRPDLILLDVMMPELDGGELAVQFRRHPKLKTVPIVFLTAAVDKQEVKARNGVIGGLPFIAKPIEFQELVKCLEQHLRGRD